jgi:hypothetical protein
VAGTRPELKKEKPDWVQSGWRHVCMF